MIVKPVLEIPRIDGTGHIPDLGVYVADLAPNLPGIRTRHGVINTVGEVKSMDQDGSVKQKNTQAILDLGAVTARLPVVGMLIHDMPECVTTREQLMLWQTLGAMNSVAVFSMAEVEDTGLVRASLAKAARAKAGRISHEDLSELYDGLGPTIVGQLVQHVLGTAVFGDSPYARH